MHTKRKGSIAELAVATQLIREGWNVLLPYGENTRYDLVAERDGRFARLQVKYCTPKDGSLIVNCASSNNWSVLQYTAKEIDAIAVYDPLAGTVYFVPVAELPKGHMKLRLSPTKNGQKAKVRFAKEFCEFHDGKGSYELSALVGAGT